jgi:peptide/nickel transport system ATP-binding protein
MTALLCVENLSIEVRGTRDDTTYAVSGVDLTVRRGEIIGLVGETGSGKSLTSQAMLGLVRPPAVVTSGRVLLDGSDLLTLPPDELRRVRGPRVAYIPQEPRAALHPQLPVERQMRNVIASHEGRRRRADDRARCRALISAVGIPDPERLLASYPHELSGGMAQRVAIAIAFLLEPELIVADEPTTGLDVTVQAQILELFTRSARERSAAAVLVTHDLGVVAHYCQRLAVMYAGQIVERGPVREVFRAAAHPYTCGLLASLPVIGMPLRHMAGHSVQMHRPPHGCSFAPRCPHATEECRRQRPPWQRSSESHEAFCHWPRAVDQAPTSRSS